LTAKLRLRESITENEARGSMSWKLGARALERPGTLPGSVVEGTSKAAPKAQHFLPPNHHGYAGYIQFNEALRTTLPRLPLAAVDKPGIGEATEKTPGPIGTMPDQFQGSARGPKFPRAAPEYDALKDIEVHSASNKMTIIVPLPLLFLGFYIPRWTLPPSQPTWSRTMISMYHRLNRPRNGRSC
jgi:hypothetical protein